MRRMDLKKSLVVTGMMAMAIGLLTGCGSSDNGGKGDIIINNNMGNGGNNGRNTENQGGGDNGIWDSENQGGGDNGIWDSENQGGNSNYYDDNGGQSYQDEIEYGYDYYVGYWANMDNEVCFYISDEFEWGFSRIQESDYYCRGYVNWDAEGVELVQASGEKIYTKLYPSYSEKAVYDDAGVEYYYYSDAPSINDGPYEGGPVDGYGDSNPVLTDGCYYLNDDYSAESYIYIDGTNFSLYARYFGDPEGTLADEGYYTAVDLSGNFVAYSTEVSDLTYVIEDFGNGTIKWDGDYYYLK